MQVGVITVGYVFDYKNLIKFSGDIIETDQKLHNKSSCYTYREVSMPLVFSVSYVKYLTWKFQQMAFLIFQDVAVKTGI